MSSEFILLYLVLFLIGIKFIFPEYINLILCYMIIFSLILLFNTISISINYSIKSLLERNNWWIFKYKNIEYFKELLGDNPLPKVDNLNYADFNYMLDAHPNLIESYTREKECRDRIYEEKVIELLNSDIEKLQKRISKWYQNYKRNLRNHIVKIIKNQFK